MRLFPNKSADVDQDLMVLEEIIQEFDAIDPNSVVFRYPVDQARHVTLPAIAIDLPRLRQVMEWVAYMLDGWRYGVSEYLNQGP